MDTSGCGVGTTTRRPPPGASRPPPARPQEPLGTAKGVLAGPGTPRAQNQPQITPFWHQMGRHPTVLHIRGGILRRIPARFSPDRSHPLNLNFFSAIFSQTNAKKCIFWEGFEKILENRPGWPKMPPQGPGGPWGPIFRYFWAPGGPWGPPLGGGPGAPLFGPIWLLCMSIAVALVLPVVLEGDPAKCKTDCQIAS